MLLTPKRTSLFFMLIVFNTAHSMQREKIETTGCQKELELTLFTTMPCNQIQAILDKKANVNALNIQKNYTALHHTLVMHYQLKETNLEDRIKLLLSNGARVDIQDILGRTPFHIVAKNYDLELCTLLVNHMQKIQELFKTAHLLFTIHRYCLKKMKIPVPKPILFLILNFIEPIRLPLNKKEYPPLRTILEQKSASSTNLIDETAYDIVHKEYELQTDPWISITYYARPDSIEKLEKMKALLNPQNYSL